VPALVLLSPKTFIISGPEPMKKEESVVTYFPDRLYFFQLINENECHGFLIHCTLNNEQIQLKCYSAYGGLYSIQVYQVTPLQVRQMIDGNLPLQAVFWGDLPHLFFEYFQKNETHKFQIDKVISKSVDPLDWEDLLLFMQKEERRLNNPVVNQYMNELREIMQLFISL
jgi:hypothetical protein